MMRKKAILLIDPVSSSEYSFSRFKELGYGLIVIKTISFTNQNSEQHHALCDVVIHSRGNLTEDLLNIEQLNEAFDILHGITGVEANFKYAEAILSACFPNASNAVTTSHYRCDKYWMNEVLRKQGIKSIRQSILPQDLDLATQCQKTIEFFYLYHQYIVIKPKSESAASVGVFSPKSEHDIYTYFRDSAKFLFQNSDYLLQERIFGDEYYIDAASYCGKHYITSMGKYHKDLWDGQFVYRYVDALHLDTPLADELKAFVTQCLDQLHMHNGLSHCEVIHTTDGFRLVELNPRTSGVHGFFNRMAHRNYGLDQISCYINLLNQNTIIPKKNPIHQRLYLLQNKTGAFNNFNIHDIAQLRSYSSHKVLIEKSDGTSNKSLLGTVALILLADHDQNVIFSDTKLIESYEETGACFIQ